MLSSPPFLTKTYDMVDDPSTDKIVSWSSEGHSFIVWNISDLCTVLLPQYFKHNNFSSFVRQLNTYGFRKICSDQWEFAIDGFSRGNKDGLKTIHRRKPSTSPSPSPSSSSASSSMDHLEADQQHKKCVYTESVCSKLLETTAKLQQDKATLVIDLTNLNRQRRLTDEDLDEFKERLLMLENRQQQILSLVTQAAMNPGFFNRVSMQRVVDIHALMPINKKRKLLEANDEEIIVQFEDDQCWRKNDRFNRIDNAITTSTMSPMRILGRHSMSLLGGNRSKNHVTRMDTRIASEHNLNEVCEDVMPHHFQVNDNRGQIALHKVADCVVSLPSQSACKEVDKKSVVQSLQTNKYKEMDKNSTNNGFWGKYLTESPTTDVESDVETDVETEGNPL